MSKIQVRGGIISLSAIMEKRMKERIDRRINVRGATDSKPFRKGLETEAKRMLKMVRQYEDKGDPSIDLQKILHKAADVSIMALLIVQVLNQRLQSERGG